MGEEPYSHIAATNGFIRATMRLLTAQEGGHGSAIWGEYRPNWSVGVADATALSGAPVVIEGNGRIEPGDSAPVRLFPFWPEYWRDVRPGTELFAFEGTRLVATAVVTELMPPTRDE